MLPSIDSFETFFTMVYNNDVAAVEDALATARYDKKLIARLAKLSFMVWEDFLNDFRQIEYERNIPYELQETAKFYALDLLVIADSLGYSDEELLRRIALIYLTFYMNIHYFDDHVEDPDKFHKKFRYSSSLPLVTQQGAAPFSFQLASLQVLEKNLESLSMHHSFKTKGLKLIRDAYLRNMINMTSHLVKERQGNMSHTKVMQVKNHGIFKAWADFTATLINVCFPEKAVEHAEFATALCSVGSLTQITDDLRDIQKDFHLGNINIFSAAIEGYGRNEAFRLIAQVYYNEEQVSRGILSRFMDEEKLQNIMFIPFYPFTISKSESSRRPSAS